MQRHARTSYQNARRAARRRGTASRAPRTATVRGQVVDDLSGARLAGASLSLLRFGLGAPPGPRDLRVSRADADGRFELSRPAGPVVLLVRCEGYLPELTAVAGRRGDVVVRLARAGAVSGAVMADDGAPVAGLRLVALSPSAMDVREGATDAAGRFHIDGLRPGRYVVKPLDPLATPRVAPVVAEVRAGEIARAALRASDRAAPLALRLAS